jgi:hypothetical protein
MTTPTSPSFPNGLLGNRSEAEVRAAMDLARAQEAYSLVWRESLKSEHSIERKAELILELDVASDAMFKARMALNAATRAREAA